MRTRQARDLIAAAYHTTPEAVPTGFLRALSRVEDTGSDKPGFDPLVHCESYRRLFDIFTTERHGRKANALRFCGSLRSSHIYAAEHLAPALVYPEIVAIMDSAAHVERANALLDLIRASVSTITEDEITQALKQSLRSGSILDRFARKALERADRLPEPPLPECEYLRPLRTAAEVTEFGARMGNCASTKIIEIALGLFCIFEASHRLPNGTIVPLAVSLTPLTNGGWVVADVSMRDNQRPPRHVLRAVLGRLQDLGVVVAGPSLAAPYRQDVARLLGVHRWAPIDDCLRPLIDAKDEADAVEALMAEIGEAA